jgi:hypothetical protein
VSRGSSDPPRREDLATWPGEGGQEEGQALRRAATQRDRFRQTMKRLYSYQGDRCDAKSDQQMWEISKNNIQNF